MNAAYAAYNKKEFKKEVQSYLSLTEDKQAAFISSLDAETAFDYGVWFASGMNAKRDYDQVIRFFNHAVELKHADAAFYLGNLYYSGKGVTKDYSKAIELYTLGSDQGDANSQYILGSIYYDGVHVTKDLSKAIELFTLAAETRSADEFVEKARYRLALMYERGHGTKKNDAMAYKYYELAAKRRNSEALFRSGVLNMEGRGTPRNYEKAFEYFTKSADLGDSRAMFNLAVMNANGMGTPKHIEYAHMWKHIYSLRNPNSEGLERLRKMLPEIRGEAKVRAENLVELCIAKQFKRC